MEGGVVYSKDDSLNQTQDWGQTHESFLFGPQINPPSIFDLDMMEDNIKRNYK